MEEESEGYHSDCTSAQIYGNRNLSKNSNLTQQRKHSKSKQIRKRSGNEGYRRTSRNKLVQGIYWTFWNEMIGSLLIFRILNCSHLLNGMILDIIYSEKSHNQLWSRKSVSGNYQMSKAENDQDTTISNEVTNASDNTNLKTIRFFNFCKDVYESIRLW